MASKSLDEEDEEASEDSDLLYTKFSNSADQERRLFEEEEKRNKQDESSDSESDDSDFDEDSTYDSEEDDPEDVVKEDSDHAEMIKEKETNKNDKNEVRVSKIIAWLDAMENTFIYGTFDDKSASKIYETFDKVLELHRSKPFKYDEWEFLMLRVAIL